jgi:hypothetical protein
VSASEHFWADRALLLARQADQRARAARVKQAWDAYLDALMASSVQRVNHPDLHTGPHVSALMDALWEAGDARLIP